MAIKLVWLITRIYEHQVVNLKDGRFLFGVSKTTDKDGLTTNSWRFINLDDEEEEDDS